MELLCEKCVEDKILASYIISHGKKINTCDICKSTNVQALSCENHEFQCLFKALIRYYFNEWDYNDHWGGDNLESLLTSSPVFFSGKAKQDPEDLESAILTLIEKCYEEYETGVSLYAGYDEGGVQNRLLEAIHEGTSSTIASIATLSKSQNYYEFEESAEKIIDRIIRYVDRTDFEPRPLFRARIGYRKIFYPHDGFKRTPYYDPYQKISIHAPSPELAAKGRMNRENVSFLYLASDEETAIAEVRPHPGHIVSLGAFQATKRLRLADFASAQILDFYQNDRLLDIYADIVAISSLFSIPVPPSDKYKYIATQLVSDLIRQKGFDGISFRSSMSDGVNFAFFNPKHFTYVEGSANAVCVKSLTYSCSPADLYNPEDESSFFDPDNL